MVYVDPLMRHGWRLRGHTIESCHLWADTQDELDGFAFRIGMKMEWRQRSKTGLVHYDLTPRRREAAILNGAQPLDRRQAADFIRARMRKPKQ